MGLVEVAYHLVVMLSYFNELSQPGLSVTESAKARLIYNLHFTNQGLFTIVDVYLC